MKYLEKHPMVMIAVGIMGISLSSIFVKYSQAPSAVTAAWRLLWTVALMPPVVAAVLAGFLFGEVPGMLQFLGGGLILGGVFFYSRIECRESNG